MKFSFGQYKGQEVTDVAHRDPAYLLWVLQNCMNIEDDEYMDIRQHYKQLPEWQRQRLATEIFQATKEDLECKYLGKYLKGYDSYFHVRRISEDSLAIKTHRLYGLFCQNAEHAQNQNIFVQHDAVPCTLGYLAIDDLMHYEECSKEEWYTNIDKLIIKMRNT